MIVEKGERWVRVKQTLTIMEGMNLYTENLYG